MSGCGASCGGAGAGLWAPRPQAVSPAVGGGTRVGSRLSGYGVAWSQRDQEGGGGAGGAYGGEGGDDDEAMLLSALSADLLNDFGADDSSVMSLSAAPGRRLYG